MSALPIAMELPRRKLTGFIGGFSLEAGSHIEPDDAQKVERMKAALAMALGEHHTVTVAAKMCGRAAVLSIENVPLAQATTVLDALKTAL